MKILWLALGLLLLVVAAAVALFMHTAGLHDDLHSSLERVEAATRAENWEAARQAAQHLDRQWVKANAFWSPLMDHRELNTVDEVVVRVVKLTEQRMRRELLVELGVALRLIHRLKETELPRLGNGF